MEFLRDWNEINNLDNFSLDLVRNLNEIVLTGLIDSSLYSSGAPAYISDIMKL